MMHNLLDCTPLNLPSYRYITKQESGKWYILDIVYRRYMVLTEEEWVRQHMLNYLICHLAYPKGLCYIERKVPGLHKCYRPDIVCCDRLGDPLLVVECKSAQSKLNHRALSQLTEYNRHLHAELIILTNGLSHFCWKLDLQNGYFKPIKAIPMYNHR